MNKFCTASIEQGYAFGAKENKSGKHIFERFHDEDQSDGLKKLVY